MLKNSYDMEFVELFSDLCVSLCNFVQ